LGSDTPPMGLDLALDFSAEGAALELEETNLPFDLLFEDFEGLHRHGRVNATNIAVLENRTGKARRAGGQGPRGQPEPARPPSNSRTLPKNPAASGCVSLDDNFSNSLSNSR